MSVDAERDEELGRDIGLERGVGVVFDDDGRVKGVGAGAGGMIRAEEGTARVVGAMGGGIPAR